MNIVVCTKRDLHGALFLNHLLPRLGAHRVAGVWLSDKTREAELAVPELAALRHLERTLPIDGLFPFIDALRPETAALAPCATFVGLARRHGVAIEVVHEVNGEAARSKLAALEPDLVLVARFSHIFDARTIAVPRFGLLNAHPGQLPEYAGLQAPLRSVNDGASALCCSVHWIVPGIDAGPLLAQHWQPLDRRRPLLDQVGELYPLAIPTMLQVAAECQAGRRPPGTEQDFSRRRYRSMPGPEEFETLRRLGQPLWTEAGYRDELALFTPPGVALPAMTLP